MRRTRSSRNTSQKNAAENRDVNTKTVWQWEGDEGQWESYPPSACALLDSTASSGKTSVTLTLGSGTAYEINLKKMVQINPVTKYKRKIRSQTVKAENSSEALGEAQPARAKEEEEEEETEQQPVAKKRRGQSRSETKKEMPEEEVKSEEVVRTVVMKGKAPVDPECKTKLGKAHVYNEGTDVFDVMLNQTNLQFNNNKYYLIQLLEDDSSKAYSVWMRWGRVGKVGQSSLVACGADLLKAKDVFKKKFLDKTKNEWEHRGSFEKVAGKYDMVFMDYSANEKEENQTAVDAAPKRKPSTLHTKVQSLLELICDLKAMEECVLEMKFDTKKAPLGKLTQEQIRAGYAALKKIEDCLKKKGGSRELLEACNQFYTRIPHDFGLKTPPVIRTEEELKEKIALLEALSDIQIAVKMVQSNTESDEHPLDRQYHSLQCKLQPLDSTSHEYQVVEKYLQTSHAPTHCDYTMTVLDVFSVDRDEESNSFLSQLHNRTLLWHGSRLSNWVGILSKGLRVAPPEAPVTGYMFGKGIYFADMSSKSANYCFANQSNHIGLLLLCEVALGDCNELLDADYEANNLPAGKHSTKGLGQTGPDLKNTVQLNGATVPMGPPVKTGVGRTNGYSLLYNEFIVYNPAQVRMKYLLRVRFNYSSLW
ncbi:poly [ADP-ribose] polymerase 2 [Austrofundulus limnaeus]|uniref:Poly [ADP-ribose] polymerase n=1 Tax=Austrofundulus limnaeus TaxID=52670 RepID=A0A2I4BL46_AUSLI|nr:PREDICTED: poly [ADP-ribose] polymerase 2 [Austrofundulus limnaeus]